MRSFKLCNFIRWSTDRRLSLPFYLILKIWKPRHTWFRGMSMDRIFSTSHGLNIKSASAANRTISGLGTRDSISWRSISIVRLLSTLRWKANGTAFLTFRSPLTTKLTAIVWIWARTPQEVLEIIWTSWMEDSFPPTTEITAIQARKTTGIAANWLESVGGIVIRSPSRIFSVGGEILTPILRISHLLTATTSQCYSIALRYGWHASRNRKMTFSHFHHILLNFPSNNSDILFNKCITAYAPLFFAVNPLSLSASHHYIT